ncbi:hypothetical protein OA187_02140 [Candidatus Pelagibacter sp.]|nr:hypothetical protein [Candidatus Pelagibacter sp.]
MNILFILTDKAYIRNYFDTNIIKYLQSKHSIKFLKRENIDFDKSNNFNFENYNVDKNRKIKTIFFDLLINRYKYKSSYFKFRLKRFYRFDFRFLGELCDQKNQTRNIINKFFKLNIIFKNFFIFCVISFLSSKIFFPLINFFFKNFINLNSSFEQKIISSNCDLLLVPTSGYSSEIYDILRISKKYNIKVNFLIDNWDNLSSKMIFFEQPNKLFVWGEQTAIHAQKIHNIPRDNIIEIGSARYSDFFKERNKELKSHFDFNYILFLGSSWSWNEEEVLDRIDNIIESNKDIFVNTKVIYRYHPFRQRKNRSNLNWKNIIVDPQLLKLEKNQKRDWPDINYYPSLIQNCEFAVGGFTTMLLEVTIFYKKFIGIGFDDNKSLMNQKNALAFFEHLKEIKKLSNLSICTNQNSLESMMIEKKKSSKILNKDIIDSEREYFLTYNKEKSYQEILVENL